MFVKPAPDPERPGKFLIVRDPLHMTPIPAQGRHVPDINYWHQRIRDKDLILAEPPVEAPIVSATKITTEAMSEMPTDLSAHIADLPADTTPLATQE